MKKRQKDKVLKSFVGENLSKNDCIYYLTVFKDRLIDENNSLATVRELLDSNDKDCVIMAGEMLRNLTLKSF